MGDNRRDEDPTALPSGRALIFGLIALAISILLTAWILSIRLKRGEEPAPARAAAVPVAPASPPPPLVEPTAGWKDPAGVLDDARAVSALMRVFEGKWTDADRHVQSMYRAEPRGDEKAARAGNEAGLARFRAGEYARAAKAFELASQADPGDVEVANNLGYARMKAGRVREGIPHVLRALHLDPKRSSAWANLSEALAELGHEDAALAALLLALRYSANRDDTRDFLIKSAQDHPSEPFRRQSARALKRIDSVPRS